MKQLFTLTKKELKDTLQVELFRLQTLGKKKEVKKIETTLKAIENASEETTFKIEGVKGNTEDRQMVNIGSIFECLVKHYLKGYETLFKSFNEEKEDYKQGFVNIEIKCSLANARNTSLKEEKSLILVNHKGVYRIKKEASLNVPLDSQGRYYENEDYSQYQGVRYITSLSKKLGLA